MNLEKKITKAFFIVMITSTLTSAAAPWQNSNQMPLYFYAPGIVACESQAANYCPEMNASTGETILNSNTYQLFPKDHVRACNFIDAMPKGCNSITDEARGLIRRFFFGMAGLAHKTINVFAPYFINQYYLRRGLAIIKDNLPCTVNPFKVRPFFLSFGQKKDIETFTSFYEEQTKQEPDRSIVLYGPSRGAATIFNFMATQYHQQNIKNVKAIILESCFGSMAHCIPTLFSKFLGQLLPYYTHRGLEPIRPDILQSFINTCNTYSIPVLFITSTQDNRVPSSCVNNLLINLLTNNLNSCYLTTLSHSRHSQYMRDNEEDTALLLKAVHSFYQQSDLPYISDLATAHITKKSFYEIK